MAKSVDPKKFGIHPSTKLEQSGNKSFAIVIDRKSRLIMKDGEKILDKTSKIKSSVNGAEIHIRTTAPVCSKTKKMLEDHDILIIEV